MRWLKTLFPALVVIVLAGALCQVGVGARFTETGEQTGLALPVSSIVLGIAFLLCVLAEFPVIVPTLALPQALFLAAVAIGLLGLPRIGAATGIKEMIQIAEMTLVASYLFERVARAGHKQIVARALGGLCLLLLLLGSTGLRQHSLIALSAAKCAALVVVSTPFLFLMLRNSTDKTRLAVVLVAGTCVGIGFQHGGMILLWCAVATLCSLRFDGVSTKWLVLCLLMTGLASLVPFAHPVNPWRALHPRYDAEHLSRPVIEAIAAAKAPRYFPLGGGPGQYKRTINELKQYQSHVPHPNDRTIPRDGNNQYLLTAVESGVPAALMLLILLAGGAFLPAFGRGSLAPPDFARSVAFLGALLAGGFCVLLSRGSCIWMGALLGLANAARPLPSGLSRRARLALPVLAVGAALTTMFLFNRQQTAYGGVSTANRWVRRRVFGETGLESLGLRVIPLRDDMEAEPVAGDVIHVEAETFASTSRPFTTVSDNDASGHRALAIPQGKGKGEGATVYEVEIPSDGFYVLYARVYWQDGCSNSLLFETPADQRMLASDTFLRWHTLEARKPLLLRKGSAKIQICNVEDGVRLDAWGLRRAR
jgi:hypothetical protein